MLQRLLKWLWQGVAILDLVFLSLIMLVLAYLPGKLIHTFYRKLFRHWCQVFVAALGIDLRLHQHFQEPLPDTYILIANHPSIFEDIGIPSLFDTYPVAKEELRNWVIGGRIAQAAGTLFVQRESPESRKSLSQAIVDALQEGKNVALFPEGGCKGKRIHEFRWGIFEISLEAGIPIVPVFLHYEAQDEFEWKDNETAPQKIWKLLNLTNNRANYHVFDAFHPTDFDDKAAYCDHVHQQYLQWQKEYLD
ncbi:MAG: 1-acyl-sn-glycerol-3-phosphate acyltransferase [Gammaproteobacteria bacterium]|nr:1-acyl-sn-glycerol-3-phosphate acyltransferase [Gammaproteobacteria bacterium]